MRTMLRSIFASELGRAEQRFDPGGFLPGEQLHLAAQHRRLLDASPEMAIGRSRLVDRALEMQGVDDPARRKIEYFADDLLQPGILEDPGAERIHQNRNPPPRPRPGAP